MESESTESQGPSILIPEYSLSEMPLSTALYSQRTFNDTLSGEVLDLISQNKALAERIAELRQSTPSFLSNWWKKGVGAAEIPALMGKIEDALAGEMETMEAAISSSRAQKEVEELEVEKETEEQEELQRRKAELQETLARLEASNNSRESELDGVLSQRKDFYTAISELQEHRNLLQLESSLLRDEKNRIKAAFPHDSEEAAQEKYYSEMKALLSYLLDRKVEVQSAAAQAAEELERTNAQIEQYEQESRVNQVRKENIVSQHVELRRLREQLADREQRRREAEDRKAQLERAYCEEEMERVTGDYQSLQRRLENLLGKSLSLARISSERARLQALETVISREPEL